MTRPTTSPTTTTPPFAKSPVRMWPPAAAAAAVVRRPFRPRSAARSRPAHVPTPSEKAVHVHEDVSKVFVIAAVAVFVAILLYGLLFGTGGLFTPHRDPESESVCRTVRERVGRSLGFGFGVCAGIGQPVAFGCGVGARVRVRGSLGIGIGAGLRRRPRPPPARRSQPGLSCPHGDRGGRRRHHGPPTGADGRRAAPGPRHPRRARPRGDGRDPARAVRRRAHRRRAYADEAVPIDAGQTISQPYIVARMTELLAPRPGDRVLELGTGSGYQAAILAALGADVLSLERHAGARRSGPRTHRGAGPSGDRVEVRVADGSLGDPAGAPCDGIIVTAAAPAIPVELRDQLADGGRLVIPVGPRDRQMLTLVVRHGERLARDGRTARASSCRSSGPAASRTSASTPSGPSSDRRRARGARYTRPAMTHVFVAPHPDDVALSCGGLIASLRELGQNVTIVTVFSGNGAGEGLTPYQREALGFGSKAIWPVDRGVQPRRHRCRLPDRRPPPWAADDEPARGDPGRGRPGGQALLAALVVVSPGEHPQRVAGRPAGHRRPADPGRGPDRGGRRCGRRRRPDGPATARGRALRLLRRGVDRLPRPARRGLPRLRGRRRSCSARRVPTTPRRSTSSPGDRPARAAEGLPAARRRRARRPSARAATSASRCSTSAGAG